MDTTNKEEPSRISEIPSDQIEDDPIIFDAKAFQQLPQENPTEGNLEIVPAITSHMDCEREVQLSGLPPEPPDLNAPEGGDSMQLDHTSGPGLVEIEDPINQMNYDINEEQSPSHSMAQDAMQVA